MRRRIFHPGDCSLVVAFAILLTIGCGGSRIYKVNPDMARQTLISVLEHWKAGESLESLRDRKPEIVVQDLDWSSGSKLTTFAFEGDGESLGANLSVKVSLTLQTRDGTESKKVVKYLVTTAPVLTVFRDIF
ncbi:MAG: hypothetical protein FJ267_19065 [Planctomycetes bacterium]|nr:hypothetical protein [Planctomycetota bacterium]